MVYYKSLAAILDFSFKPMFSFRSISSNSVFFQVNLYTIHQKIVQNFRDNRPLLKKIFFNGDHFEIKCVKV